MQKAALLICRVAKNRLNAAKKTVRVFRTRCVLKGLRMSGYTKSVGNFRAVTLCCKSKNFPSLLYFVRTN